MHGAQQLAVLKQGFGQGMLAGAGLEFAGEQGRGDMAELETAADAAQVVPVLVDHLDAGGVGEQRAGPGPAGFPARRGTLIVNGSRVKPLIIVKSHQGRGKYTHSGGNRPCLTGR